MAGELTLDMLNKAIEAIDVFGKDNEVIGVVVNPEDLVEINAGTMMVTGIINKNLVMLPPYQGFEVHSSQYVPRGWVMPLRLTDRGIDATK